MFSALINLVVDTKEARGQSIVLRSKHRGEQNVPDSVVYSKSGLVPGVERQEDGVLREEGYEDGQLFSEESWTEWTNASVVEEKAGG